MLNYKKLIWNYKNKTFLKLKKQNLFQIVKATNFKL